MLASQEAGVRVEWLCVYYNGVYMVLKYSQQTAYVVTAYCSKCIIGPSQVQTCLESYLKFVFSGTLSLILCNITDLWVKFKMENDFHSDIIRMS